MTKAKRKAGGAKGKLGKYERKRDFAATPEPPVRKGAKGSRRKAPRFVVQEHSARRLHWDLRLEHEAVAVSWAIPNGIPEDPSENRKAVHTEDHPLEYLEFEGEIPAGEYGAGSMLTKLPAGADDWATEIKWDGVRAIAYCRPGRLELQTRNLNDVTAQYAEVRRLTRQLGSRDAVLDGELVAFDANGSPSFERLQQRIHQTSESIVRRRMKTHPVTYVIFDLLYLEGEDLMGEPYSRRRELLEGLELSGESWQTPAYSVGQAKELLAAGAQRGLEGIVLKRLDSRYMPGRRTGAWLKVTAISTR